MSHIYYSYDQYRIESKHDIITIQNKLGIQFNFVRVYIKDDMKYADIRNDLSDLLTDSWIISPYIWQNYDGEYYYLVALKNYRDIIQIKFAGYKVSSAYRIRAIKNNRPFPLFKDSFINQFMDELIRNNRKPNKVYNFNVDHNIRYVEKKDKEYSSKRFLARI